MHRFRNFAQPRNPCRSIYTIFQFVSACARYKLFRSDTTTGFGGVNTDSKTTSMRIRERTGCPSMYPGLNFAPKNAFFTAPSTSGRSFCVSGITSRTTPSSSICNTKISATLSDNVLLPGHCTVISCSGTGGAESLERGWYSSDTERFSLPAMSAAPSPLPTGIRATLSGSALRCAAGSTVGAASPFAPITGFCPLWITTSKRP